jgi:hypothetical protein
MSGATVNNEIPLKDEQKTGEEVPTQLARKIINRIDRLIARSKNRNPNNEQKCTSNVDDPRRRYYRGARATEQRGRIALF